ncbi:unnamed protein product, partial [Sphacelaria rigidula]
SKATLLQYRGSALESSPEVQYGKVSIKRRDIRALLCTCGCRLAWHARDSCRREESECGDHFSGRGRAPGLFALRVSDRSESNGRA